MMVLNTIKKLVLVSVFRLFIKTLLLLARMNPVRQPDVHSGGDG